MLDLFWQRLDQSARGMVPFITTLLCVLLSVIVWPLPHLGVVTPPFVLVALYYWTLHRPDLFGPASVFVVGLLFDIIHNLPLGLSALLFVGAHHVILSQRRYFTGHSFFMMWIGFALTAFIVMFIQWLLLCLIRWQGVPLFPVLVQLVFVVLIFPLPCWVFIRLQRATFG